MATATTSDAILTRFLDLHPRKIDLSLGRLEALLAKLDHPEKKLPPVIHVAGTNGKGSTVAFMRAMLEAAGQNVHVYTSPHLVHFHERIRLGASGGGRLVDEEALIAALEACERANDGAAITVFEIITATALLLFSQHPADVLLLEVGLGGRYDATNVIDKPTVSVITPVSIDHVEFLGSAIEGIALEKAGILKRGAPGVIGWQDMVVREVIEREAEKVGAPLVIAGQDFNCYEERGRFVYEDTIGLVDLPLPRLLGHHQLENAATAIAALRQFMPNLPAQCFEAGVRTAVWPARLHRLRNGPLIALLPQGSELWLDGGHNVAGGRVLAEAMADFEEQTPRPLILICGTLTTKDTAGFLANFRDLAREVIAVPIGGEHQARSAADVAAAAQTAGLSSTLAESFEAALQTIATRSWPVAPRVLIAGSLYLAGEVLKANGTPPD
ncbi:folylpolyglutamate synthase/dihydrofolate synthase family protein [Methylocella sp. CPCC 101449]|uniref:bifunctional folylpolyglutamate synthase/dihydrofolate synthase n=1 Tax=Methylocella sp. CPCC 101449 TaxID=2987531 RepID=UPI00288F87F2|nr:folylpolyglutamate synthase/dihydrofolate synthase family protein [Methylocella sp. CPCC 101449]MDT2019849.1 bifunctional folylpolyglutamate synthase/dihydrofolate synthase [Methylocella sp. CPCC 101449]